jgi:hypothetical protein
MRFLERDWIGVRDEQCISALSLFHLSGRRGKGTLKRGHQTAQSLAHAAEPATEPAVRICTSFRVFTDFAGQFHAVFRTAVTS